MGEDKTAVKLQIESIKYPLKKQPKTTTQLLYLSSPFIPSSVLDMLVKRPQFWVLLGEKQISYQLIRDVSTFKATKHRLAWLK